MKSLTETAAGIPAAKPHLQWYSRMGFILAHIGCLAVIWTGYSSVALAVCALTYGVRMFGITGGYHRYFAHRTFKTSRWFQFILACLGASAGQLGPLWWAAHHRSHHRHTDTAGDIHSPGVHGFWWAHVGWLFCQQYKPTRSELIKDFYKYPELRWINAYNKVPVWCLLAGLYGLGFVINAYYPELEVTPMQLVVWGGLISTCLLYHATFSVNSIAHSMGSQRFATQDQSRNNVFIALLTFGEGWHNNHHYFPYAERHGLAWWEIDITHYMLSGLAQIGLIWDVKKPSKKYLTAASLSST